MFSWHTRLLRFLFLYLCICILSPLLFSSHALAYANADPITITSQTDTISFPKGIDFQMSAQDAAGAITRATLLIIYNSEGYQAQRVVNPPNPSQSVTLSWHENTTGNGFAPPGTQISYFWRLQDNTGHTYTEAAQNFTVIDNRFTWQHLSQGLLQVNWYNQSTTFGQAVLDQASTNLKRISANLGGELQHPINLWVYKTEEDFHSSLPPDTQEWVGGIAFPTLNQATVVVDTLTANTLIRDMPHELTHLVFHQLTEQGILAPTWIDEGLAVYNQLYREPEMTRRLKDGLNTHSLLRLSDITMHFPADADKAYLAYAQSWNLVDYMYNTFGKAKMAALIRAMNNSRSDFEGDVTRALGVDLPHLENQWHLYLNQPAILSSTQAQPASQAVSNQVTPPTMTDSNAPFLLLLGGLLILLPIIGMGGLFAYQRRSREKAVTIQGAQHMINARLASRNAAMGPFFPAGSSSPIPPSPYPASWQQPPYRQTQPDIRAVRPPQSLSNTPVAQWGPVYPAPSENGSGQPDPSNTLSQHFSRTQEYVGQRPNKQAPQE